MSMNLGTVDPRSLIGTGKVGLLKATGTYDVNRYPWAYDCWKRQQQTIGWARKCRWAPISATGRPVI